MQRISINRSVTRKQSFINLYRNLYLENLLLTLLVASLHDKSVPPRRLETSNPVSSIHKIDKIWRRYCSRMSFL
jgi:hypothetical protein